MVVTKQQIKNSLLVFVTENTSFNTDFDSLEHEVNFHVDELYSEINDFYTIEQEDIDLQNEDYTEDYLYGAVDGSLVWAGESEVYLSSSSVEGYLREADERINNDYNDLRDIARYVKYFLIIEALENANS